MRWLVFAEGDDPNYSWAEERDAVERAKQLARDGNVVRVYKLVETHYFDANYHQKVNM